MPWRYEPDEVPKRKHHWSEDRAGFVTVKGVEVGKCPASLSVATAESLLEAAVPWWPRGWRRKYPQRLYIVYGGVVYRAIPTNPGVSYHGFPELPSLFPPSAKEVKEALLEGARASGQEEEVKKWMGW